VKNLRELQRVIVQLDARMVEQLRDTARDERITLGDVIRQALADYLRASGRSTGESIL
jgi:hypothetical protein